MCIDRRVISVPVTITVTSMMTTMAVVDGMTGMTKIMKIIMMILVQHMMNTLEVVFVS